METVVKIPKGLVFAREIYCDICSDPIKPEDNDFWAVFWKEKGKLYLEKYICEDCGKQFCRKRRVTTLSKASYEMKEAIVNDSVAPEHKVYVAEWNFWGQPPQPEGRGLLREE